MTQTDTNPIPESEIPETEDFDLDAAEAAANEAEAQARADAAEDDPEARIAELETEVETLKADYLRALAEAQNTKRMAEKRIQDNSKYAVANFAKELLTVCDNLSRALLAAPADVRAMDKAVETLAVGVEMTEKELISALGKYGVVKVVSQDAPFDPHLHQAVQEVDKTDVPTGTVVQVYQDGYMMADRLLRPAMVVVSRGGPKREDGAAADGSEGVNRQV